MYAVRMPRLGSPPGTKSAVIQVGAPATDTVNDGINIQQIEDEIREVVLNMIRYYVHFAMVLEHTKIYATRRLPTAAVDNNGRLYVNPEFWTGLTPMQRLFLLAHESMHLALLHFPRTGTRDPKLANMANDWIINDLLWEQLKEEAMPPGGLLIRDPKARQEGFAKAETSEALYELCEYLLQQIMPTKGQITNHIGESLAKKYPETTKEVNEVLKEASGNGQLQLGGGFGDGGGGDMLTDAEAERLAEDAVLVREGYADPPTTDEGWKEVATQAAARGKAAGHAPAGLEALIDDLLKPKIIWSQQLVRKMTQIVCKDTIDNYTMTRPNRRSFNGSRVILPSPIGHRARGICSIDTSGSMYDCWLQAVSDFDHIRRQYKIDFYLMWQDYDVYPEGWIAHDQPLPHRSVGGGGTSFDPIFKHIEEKNLARDADFLVIFSDMIVDFPKQSKKPPGLQVIFVTYTDIVPPWGDVIKIAAP